MLNKPVDRRIILLGQDSDVASITVLPHTFDGMEGTTSSTDNNYASVTFSYFTLTGRRQFGGSRHIVFESSCGVCSDLDFSVDYLCFEGMEGRWCRGILYSFIII